MSIDKRRLADPGSRDNGNYVRFSQRTFLDVLIDDDASRKGIYECLICEKKYTYWQNDKDFLCRECGNKLIKVKNERQRESTQGGSP